MKQLLLKLEPIIWLLFGAGLSIGTMLLTGFVLVVGLAIPLGWVSGKGGAAGLAVGRRGSCSGATLQLQRRDHCHLLGVWKRGGGRVSTTAEGFLRGDTEHCAPGSPPRRQAHRGVMSDAGLEQVVKASGAHNLPLGRAGMTRHRSESRGGTGSSRQDSRGASWSSGGMPFAPASGRLMRTPSQDNLITKLRYKEVLD